MTKKCRIKLISNKNLNKCLFLLLMGLLVGSFVFFVSVAGADEKSSSQGDVKVDHQKTSGGNDAGLSEKEKSISEKGTKETVNNVSENTTKSQSQKKKIPVFWVLLPEK